MFRLSSSYRSILFIAGIVSWFLAAALSWQGSYSGYQETELNSSEIAQIASYSEAAILADNDPERIEYIKKANREFESRGAALARYFLTRQQADNPVFFFLFEAVGDTETAQMLIRAISDPPDPVDSKLPRHAGEIEVALEQVLKNESVRQDPVLLQALKETLRNIRNQSGYSDDFTIEVVISLIGNLRTPAAASYLQTLSDDPSGVVREASVKALGRTGIADIGRTLEGAMLADQNPNVRAQAAEALAGVPSSESIAKLRNALETETDPLVLDAIIQSLHRFEALPDDPNQCLQMAERGWDAEIVRIPFQCWRETANAGKLIETAISSDNMAIRSLALTELSEANPAQSLLAAAQHSPPELEVSEREQLLNSVTEILSHDISGLAERGTISSETAWLAKEALWNISDQNLVLALEYADRIHPLHYGRESTGRYGASYHLSNKDPEAYSAHRFPRQLLAAGILALLFSLLLAFPRLRVLGVSMMGAVLLWIIFMFFESGIDTFPPPPLWFLTIYCLAFVTAGLVSGIFEMTVKKKWIRFSAGPIAACITAFLVCLYTRTQELYPVDSSGWSVIFEPIGCALIALMASFVLLLFLFFLRDRFQYFEGGTLKNPA